MKCPNCNTRLVPSDHNPEAVDFCPKCWGLWLEREALHEMIRDARSRSGSSTRGVSAVRTEVAPASRACG